MPVIDTLEWPPSALAAIERLTAANERLRELLKEASDHLDGALGARSRPNSDSGDIVSRIDEMLLDQQCECKRCGGSKVEKAIAGDGHHWCPDCT